MAQVLPFPTSRIVPPARRIHPGALVRVLAGSYIGREGRVMGLSPDRGTVHVAVGGVMIFAQAHHLEMLPEGPGGAA